MYSSLRMKNLNTLFFCFSMLTGAPLFAENACMCGDQCPCTVEGHCGCMTQKQVSTDAASEIEAQLQNP